MKLDRKGARRVAASVVAFLSLALVAALVLRFRGPARAEVAGQLERLRETVEKTCERFEVSPDLVLAVIAVESKGDPAARSGKGALGLMQLMPRTAREQAEALGIRLEKDEDLTDEKLNILLGTRYLSEQLARFKGNERLALAAYHAGPGRVEEWMKAWPDRKAEDVLERAAYPSTKAYVAHVLAYRDLLAGRRR